MGPNKEWGAFLINNTLVIGIEDQDAARLVNKLYGPKILNETALRDKIQQEYLDYFSFSEFKENDYLPPLKNYTYKRDENVDLYLLLGLLLHDDFKVPDKANDIFMFTYANFSGEISPSEFLSISKTSFTRERELRDSTITRLKSGWWYHLTKDFEELVSGVGSSSEVDFDLDIAKQAQIIANKKIIRQNLLEKKCSSEITQSICYSIGQRRPLSELEGGLLVDDNLLVYLNLSKVKEYFEQKEYPPYSNEDKRNLLISLAKRSLEERKKFQENNYVDLVGNIDYEAELLVADFFDASFSADYLKNKKINTITLVGFNFEDGGASPSVINIVQAPATAFREINLQTIKSRIPYLTRSKISLFTNIIEKLLMPTEFSKTQ